MDNVQYGVADGVPLVMDVFIPAGPGPFPAVIAIHGGGWVGGDKVEADTLSGRFTAAGYALFSINYRLAPQFPFPAAVDDAATAVRYVRANAARYHVVPYRIGAVGISAGATIAAWIGMNGSGSKNAGARVAAVGGYSGIYNFAGASPSALASPTGGTAAFPHITAYLQPLTEARLKAASPQAMVDRTDPPTFLSNSTNEIIPEDQATGMNDRLSGAGVPHDLVIDQGSQHALGNGRLIPVLVPRTIAFFDTYLKTYKPEKGGVATSPLPSETTGPTAEPSPSPSATARPRRRRQLAIIALLVLVIIVLIVAVSAWARRRRRSYY